MKVMLIDADSSIPNLALMRISAYHKKQGDLVDLVKLNIPFYPTRKKKEYYPPSGYDKTYCSVIFDVNKKYIKGKNIIFGGTGHSLEVKLEEEIESLDPDYSIYPENDTSIGFITRGCIRKCYFCKVPEKEGYIHQVSTIDKVVKHEKVRFLDNNILGFDKHLQIFQELIDKNIKCSFNEGLDIRLVNKENSLLLSRLNYYPNTYIFALDDENLIKTVAKKLELLEWRKDWQFMFYCYINPDMDIEDIKKRILFLKENKCLPYIMRDISCYTAEYKNFYTDIASYCNQPAFFKKMSFENFLQKRHKNKDRIEKSILLWNRRNNE